MGLYLDKSRKRIPWILYWNGLPHVNPLSLTCLETAIKVINNFEAGKSEETKA